MLSPTTQVYLDHAASTPPLDEVVDVVARTMRMVGNAISLHSAGRRPLSAWETSERDTLVQALLEVDGNKLLAAQRLGISRTTIYRKMRSYGITLPARR